MVVIFLIFYIHIEAEKKIENRISLTVGKGTNSLNVNYFSFMSNLSFRWQDYTNLGVVPLAPVAQCLRSATSTTANVGWDLLISELENVAAVIEDRRVALRLHSIFRVTLLICIVDLA